MIHEKFKEIRDWHQRQIVDEKIRNNAKEAAVLIILISHSENEDKVIP
jgi:hypothetical protein